MTRRALRNLFWFALFCATLALLVER